MGWLAIHTIVTALCAVGGFVVGVMSNYPLTGFIALIAVCAVGFVDMLRRARRGEFEGE